MARRPSIVAFNLALAACTLLAVRPVPAVDRAVEELLAPLRVATRPFGPLASLGGGEVAARSREVRAAAAASYGLSIAEDLLLASRPTDDALLQGRRLVPARVLERRAGHRDELVLEPWTVDGLAVGLPVVVGNEYLGRVVALDRARGQVTAKLVTARDLFVGARLVPSEPDGREPVRFVVGGVVLGPRPLDGGEAPVRLAAHHPSHPDRDLDGDLVVDELLPELDAYHALSRGFGLGRLLRGASEGDWQVVPRVDFLHGIYQVMVVMPASAPPVEPPPHPIADARWVRARPSSAGDPSPWRASLALALEDGAAVPVGAAVVREARLLGRVVSATRFGADAALLGDAGLSLPVAGVPLDVPGALPRVLGRIVALGRDPDTGALRFHLRDALPLEVEGLPVGTRVRMRLVTGAGEVGLPAGLLVGDTELVTGTSGGRGRRFHLVDAPDPFDGSSPIFVRTAEAPPVVGERP
jgi:cell shape-determining protein MreC